MCTCVINGLDLCTGHNRFDLIGRCKAENTHMYVRDICILICVTVSVSNTVILN